VAQRDARSSHGADWTCSPTRGRAASRDYTVGVRTRPDRAQVRGACDASGVEGSLQTSGAGALSDRHGSHRSGGTDQAFDWLHNALEARDWHVAMLKSSRHSMACGPILGLLSSLSASASRVERGVRIQEPQSLRCPGLRSIKSMRKPDPGAEGTARTPAVVDGRVVAHQIDDAVSLRRPPRPHRREITKRDLNRGPAVTIREPFVRLDPAGNSPLRHHPQSRFGPRSFRYATMSSTSLSVSTMKPPRDREPTGSCASVKLKNR
jgi:hypothetical protein